MHTPLADLGIQLSHQPVLTANRVSGKRKLIRFDDYFHTDSFPIPTSKDEFRIYIPAQAGNQPADVLDITRTIFLWPAPPMLYPLHVLYGGVLQIDAPSKFKDAAWLYVLPFEDMTLGITTYDKAGKELGRMELKNQKKYQVTDFGFGDPAHSVRVYDVGGAGKWGLVRAQCYV